MMEWNYDMSAAPKGETRDFTAKIKGEDVPRTVKVKVPVLISTDTDVIASFWSEKRRKWSGIADTETAIAWMLWPAPAVAP